MCCPLPLLLHRLYFQPGRRFREEHCPHRLILRPKRSTGLKPTLREGDLASKWIIFHDPFRSAVGAILIVLAPAKAAGREGVGGARERAICRGAPTSRPLPGPVECTCFVARRGRYAPMPQKRPKGPGLRRNPIGLEFYSETLPMGSKTLQCGISRFAITEDRFPSQCRSRNP